MVQPADPTTTKISPEAHQPVMLVLQGTKASTWGTMACVSAVILIVLICLAVFTSRCSEYDRTEDLRRRFVQNELRTGRWLLSMGLAYDKTVPGSEERARSTMQELQGYGLNVPSEPLDLGDHMNKCAWVNGAFAYIKART